jgi:putative membrane protein
MKLPILALVLAATTITGSSVSAQQSATETERASIVRISQANLYELEASKVAVQMADGEDIKDLAWKEVRDHELINRELITFATAKNISIASKLTPELQQRLDRIKSASGRDFDDAYLNAMITSHKSEEQFLANEASSENASDLKSFATRTGEIFKRHIAALHNDDAKE